MCYGINSNLNLIEIEVLSTDTIKLGVCVDIINDFYVVGYNSYDDMTEIDQVLHLKDENTNMPLSENRLYHNKSLIKIKDVMLPKSIYGRKQSILMNYTSVLG